MFTYCQTNPLIQYRLDYYYTSHNLQEHISKTKIIPQAQFPHHKAILLEFKQIPGEKSGPGFWKFNASLLEGPQYSELVQVKFEEWLDLQDKRLLWDLLKYKIRQLSMSYVLKKEKEAEVLRKTVGEKNS